MGKLTTHVLDTTRGKPVANLTVKLYKEVGDNYNLIKTIKTNKDGRSAEPILEGLNLEKGGFELVFQVDHYYNQIGIKSEFLKDVVIRFYIENEDENYHIPLLISPYAYSTYKGS